MDVAFWRLLKKTKYGYINQQNGKALVLRSTRLDFVEVLICGDDCVAEVCLSRIKVTTVSILQ